MNGNYKPIYPGTSINPKCKKYKQSYTKACHYQIAQSYDEKVINNWVAVIY